MRGGTRTAPAAQVPQHDLGECPYLTRLPSSSTLIGARHRVDCKGYFAAVNLDSCAPAMGRDDEFADGGTGHPTCAARSLARSPLYGC